MGMGGKQALPFSPLILHLQGADGSLRNGKNRFSPLPPDNPSIGTDPGRGGGGSSKCLSPVSAFYQSPRAQTANRVSVWRVSGWGRCSGALSPQVPFPSIRAVPIGSPCLICPFFPKATEYMFAFTALTWLLDFFFFFFSELFRKL